MATREIAHGLSPKMHAFLLALESLCREHDATLFGCGCCGSPEVTMADESVEKVNVLVGDVVLAEGSDDYKDVRLDRPTVVINERRIVDKRAGYRVVRVTLPKHTPSLAAVEAPSRAYAEGYYWARFGGDAPFVIHCDGERWQTFGSEDDYASFPSGLVILGGPLERP